MFLILLLFAKCEHANNARDYISYIRTIIDNTRFEIGSKEMVINILSVKFYLRIKRQDTIQKKPWMRLFHYF